MIQADTTPAIDASQTNSTTGCAPFLQQTFGEKDDAIFKNSSWPSLRAIVEHPKAKEKLIEMERSGQLAVVEGIKISSVIPIPAGTGIKQESRDILLKELNKNGFAIYYNSSTYRAKDALGLDTNGAVRETYDNIYRFNVLVLDMDGTAVDEFESWAKEHSFIWTAKVNTSPGKYQYIWRLKHVLRCDTEGYSNGEEGAEWITVQQHKDVAIILAATFGGDKNVCKPTQVFRLPGFKHWKAGGSGFDVTVCELYNKEYLWSEVEKAASSLVTAGGLTSSADNGSTTVSSRAAITAAVSAAASKHRTPLQAVELGMINVSAGERHDIILREATKLAHSGLDKDAITEKIDKLINENYEGKESFLPGGDRRHEVERTILCAMEYRNKNNEREIKESVIETDSRSPAGVGTSGGPGAGGPGGNVLGGGIDSLVCEPDYQYDFSSPRFSQSIYSELAIAERIFQRFGDSLIRVGETVYAFDAGRGVWTVQAIRDEQGLVQLWASIVIQSMVCERKFIETMCSDSKGNFNKDKRRSLINSYLSGKTIRSVTGLLLSHTGIKRVEPSIFDGKEHLISVLVCTDTDSKIERRVLNMRTLELREIKSSDYLLHSSRILWQGIEAKDSCTGWLKFVEEVFAQNDKPEDMASFVQELFGYTLSGSVSEQKIFCHYGYGANGKSKLLEGLKRIVGDYGTILGPDDLLIGKGFRKSFERTGAKIEGKRCCIIDDIDVGGTWNEGFVKTLTGLEYEARAEYQRTRRAVNRAKFHLGMNTLPVPEAENMGLLRRVCIIRYMCRFDPNPVKEKELAKMIRDESSGILAWAVAGYRRMMDRGLIYPEETKEEIELYREETFVVETILSDLVRPAKEGEIPDVVFVHDLLDAVNSRLPAGGARLSGSQLGAMLRSQFNLDSRKKVWCAERQNAFRAVSCVLLKPLKKELDEL